jgi:hypothetical protein
LAYKTLARSVNLKNVVLTRSFFHTAGGNTLGKQEDDSKRDLMNNFSLSNI